MIHHTSPAAGNVWSAARGYHKAKGTERARNRPDICSRCSDPKKCHPDCPHRVRGKA
jgi:hypothetical protein